MKKLISLLSICFLVINISWAQLDRSKAPEPGPAPSIQLGKYESFSLKNGMKVIVVENDKIPVVSFQVTLDIDPVFEKDAKGYVDITGELLRTGTTSRSKSQIDEDVDFIGATLSTYSTGVYGSSLKKHSAKLLDIMSDVLQNPSFPEDELEKSKTQMLSGLSMVSSDAGAMVDNLTTALVYGKEHPYGEVMTESTVKNITIDHCKQYYNTYFKPNVAYLVIVGNINIKEAKKLSKKYFESWQRGDVPKHKYNMPELPEGNVVAMSDRKGAIQSVISVTYPVELRPGDPDAIKASVMNAVLGGGVFSGRLMQNLRESKGYTYGARSSLSSDRLVGRFTARTEVRNSVTDSTATEILNEMKRMISEPVEEPDLELVKNYMNGSFARSLENPRNLANFAMNIERYNLPKDYYTTYLEKLSAVSISDISAMATKYLKPEHAYIIVGGNKEEVEPSMKKFSKDQTVQLYDAFARKIEIDNSALPEGLTAEKVIEMHLKSLGGKELLAKLNDVKIEMKASIQGQNLDIVSINKAPGKSLNQVIMNGSPVMVQAFDGEKGTVKQMGNNVPLNEAMQKDMALQAAIVPELMFEKYGITPELTGREQIESKSAYVVEYIMPSGSKAINYYEVATGQKIRTVAFIESPQGNVEQTTDFENFKEVEGYTFPHTIIQPMGPMKLEANVHSITINGGIDDSVFETN